MIQKRDLIEIVFLQIFYNKRSRDRILFELQESLSHCIISTLKTILTGAVFLPIKDFVFIPKWLA